VSAPMSARSRARASRSSWALISPALATRTAPTSLSRAQYRAASSLMSQGKAMARHRPISQGRLGP
jgi:hypothetical protein